MRTNPFRLALLLVPLAAPQLFAAEKIRISSFSTILTEIAQQVGGERVEVTAHVQPGLIHTISSRSPPISERSAAPNSSSFPRSAWSKAFAATAAPG